ncbi:MAG TPA: sensor histidine kinase [Solirubrobacteraceae bacterium]|nr:sensor histidine kinase [Solirubrobacteraceae bacterium]
MKSAAPTPGRTAAGDRRARRPRRSPPGARDLVLAAAGLGVATTVAIAAVPGLAFGLHSPELRAGIETAAAGIAFLAAYLVVGRYELSGSLVDLALIGALTFLALGNLAFSTLPALLGADDGSFVAWAPVGARLLSAVAFVAAALVPDVRLARPARAGAAMLVGVALGLGVVACVTFALSGQLASSFGPLSHDLADAPRIEGPAGFLALQAMTLLLFTVATVGFARRAARSHDELLTWIAVATALAAVARVDYLLFPAADAEWVFAGDVLRLASVLVLLVGSLREIRAYQRHVALAAVLDERRRVARELHDGLSQELAYISLQSQRLEMQGGGADATRLVDASRRALEESRQAIEALSRRADEPFGATVSKVAEQLTGRAGARLRLKLDVSVDPPPEVCDELLRILREAVTNGVRHGAADEIGVELTNGDQVRLRVTDNGAGFETDRDATGFGLVSMRERAAALGGELRVSSRPGVGTEVEVTLP